MFSCDLYGALRCPAECGRAFRERVGIVFDSVGHLVEKLVNRDESRAADVPMRRLGLPVQVDAAARCSLSSSTDFARMFSESVLCVNCMFKSPRQRKSAEAVSSAIAAAGSRLTCQSDHMRQKPSCRLLAKGSLCTAEAADTHDSPNQLTVSPAARHWETRKLRRSNAGIFGVHDPRISGPTLRFRSTADPL
jgi:hypothetical protein